MGLPQFKGAELEWGPFRCSSWTWVKGCQGHGHAAVDGCVYPWGKETDGAQHGQRRLSGGFRWKTSSVELIRRCLLWDIHNNSTTARRTFIHIRTVSLA